MTSRRCIGDPDSVKIILLYNNWTSLFLLSVCMNSVLPISSYQQKGKIVAFFQSTCALSVPNPCQQDCVDIRSGGFYCHCQPGFIISDDGMTCQESKTDVETVVSDGASDHFHPHHDSLIETLKSNNSHPVYFHQDKQFASDNNEVHIKSISLKKGLPRLQADRRVNTDPHLVLDDFYNILEGGSDDPSLNQFNILDGGGHSSEADGGPMPKFEEAAVSSSDQGESCDRTICKNNGTCTVIESRAVCLCPLGTGGELCDRGIGIRYPKFDGTGYLVLPVLRDAHREFYVSLEFRPESPNGLLLFSAELTDAKADFVSVILKDGFIIYRFDCGTGAEELKTPNRVSLAAWNKLIISRHNTRGTAQLNSGPEVVAQSQGNYTRITFRLHLYVGGYTDMAAISDRVATSHQFVGCVQELVINGHQFDFRKKGLVGESEFGVNVGECSEDVCNSVTCLNHGTCAARSADQHVCLCPLGFHGELCQKDELVHIPYFTGHSYLEFPRLERSVLSYTEIELVLKPASLDGTVLYNGYSRDRKGDFISLALRGGYLEFRFDLGTGPAVIRSYEPLATNVWYTVRASRTGLMGTLEIDGQVLRTGQAQGAYTQLTVLDSLYVGGHPNYDHTSRHANTTRSFSGCLQKVVVNKQAMNLMAGATSGVNIGPCSHPCAGSPCMNDGECKPHLDTYTCSCPIGFGNSNCEDAQEQPVTKPMFTGDSYLTYRDREITKRVSGNQLDLQIHIRPQGHNGLLFWSGLDLSKKSAQDYFSLGFHSGSLLLRFNLGSGEAMIGYNNSNLFDGNWHFVRVQRDKQNAYMEVDRKDIVEASSPGVYVSLNTNQLVYLGGMPHVAEKTRGRYTVGYSGCVRDLKLATDYNIKLLSQAHTGRNIQQCHNH